MLSVSYVGNFSRHQNIYRETNLPDPSVLPSVIAGSTPLKTVVPYPGFGSIKLAENAENAHYNSLQVNFHSRMRKDLTLQVAYTLSRSFDPAPGAGGDLGNVSNPYNRGYDYGPFAADRTAHRARQLHLRSSDFPEHFESPAEDPRSADGKYQAIGTMETGQPLDITLGGSQGSNGLANATNRPDLPATISYPQTVARSGSTPAVFSAPAIGALGNLKKGAIRGPGRDNWNVSLFKSFVFSETRGSRSRVPRGEFNTFNHTQFNGVSTSFSSQQFRPGDFGFSTRECSNSD